MNKPQPDFVGSALERDSKARTPRLPSLRSFSITVQLHTICADFLILYTVMQTLQCIANTTRLKTMLVCVLWAAWFLHEMAENNENITGRQGCIFYISRFADIH